jgi:hypothetical protein
VAAAAATTTTTAISALVGKSAGAEKMMGWSWRAAVGSSSCGSRSRRALCASVVPCLSPITAWGPRCRRHRGCGRVCAGKGDTISHALPLSSFRTLRSLSFFFFLFSVSLSYSQVSTFYYLVYFCACALAWRSPLQQIHTSHSYDLTDTEQFVMIRLPSNNETET